MLAGIAKPVQGNIEILGQVVSELDNRHGISFVVR